MVGFKLPASSGNIANVATAFAIGIGVAAVAGVAVAAAVGGFILLQQGRPLKSPWQVRKRASPLPPRQWRLAFDNVDGRLIGGGERVIGRVRRGGVDRMIRAEVWPFLLGLYNAGSTREEREQQRAQRREQYHQLRRQCLLALKHLPQMRVKSHNDSEDAAAEAAPVDQMTGVTTKSLDDENVDGQQHAQTCELVEFVEESDREVMGKEGEDRLSENNGDEEDDEVEDGDACSEMLPAQRSWGEELCRSIPNSVEVVQEAEDATLKRPDCRSGGEELSGSASSSNLMGAVLDQEGGKARRSSDDTLDRHAVDPMHVAESSPDGEKLDLISPEAQAGVSVNSQGNSFSSNIVGDASHLGSGGREAESEVFQARESKSIVLENGCDDEADRSQRREEASVQGEESTKDPADLIVKDEGEPPEVIFVEESKTSMIRPSEEPANAKRVTAVKPRCFPEGRSSEDFQMWQRIIRLDAVRMNAAWIPYSKSQAEVSEEEAARLAEEVGLTEHAHLDAPRRHHAGRLVAILEAYALHDPDIGYCQGMSDLLSPFVAMIEDDADAFWCFERFMQKARQNFRVDELGIRKQLDMIARILKAADPAFFEYLCSIGAEDCIFAYRMAVVLLRRELTFEQTISLWEVRTSFSNLAVVLDYFPKIVVCSRRRCQATP
ncbi:hypothetical protein CBR_g31439 [Chara braunii]|uniref:Rab-GAP TBC domain-containing protein n=1 Tax=Chara braunii TaxID=69332 RepID=A0A388LF87_CHABU|nr:hypothetical protein CBR_g31439 [Chara braunii]|eukprot:GBG80883.1 hypothetical protein CBR_g31439 [Chara braunii]